MTRNKLAPLLALALALAGTVLGAAARARADEPKLAFAQLTLKNGLRVILHEDHTTPTVCVVTWFKVGSKDEVAGRTGFAHLFEHLMFKGSTHVPDGKMDVLLEGAGGWSNAFTDTDMTVYQSVAAANFLEMVLWLEADRLAGLTDTMDQAKLDNQRDVVRNERRQGIDNQPYGQAEILLTENLWPKNHGYHWSTIGYHEDLVAAKLDDVKAFFGTYYLPNNATMVIAGDFDPVKARALVEKYLAWIPRGAEPRRPVYPAPAPIKKWIHVMATDDVQVPKVFVEWRAPTAFSADEAALDLAASVLSEGKSSRLYKRLVYDERVAQDVSASNLAATLAGTFAIEVTAKPGVAADKLIAAVGEEVARLAAAPPTAEELERAKSGHEAGFLHRLEAIMPRAIQLATYDVVAGDPNYLARDLERYRKVTPADVQAAVKKWLRPEARVVLTIDPEAGEADRDGEKGGGK